MSISRAISILTVGLFSAGCGQDCPSPSFAGPATVSGPVAAAGGQTMQTIIVRWPSSPKDSLPADYYRGLRLGGNGSPTPVRRAALTADREITLDLEGLDVFMRESKMLKIELILPDTRGWVKCSHVGMSDSYGVTLTLSFDGAGRATGAEFSRVDRFPGAL